MSIFPPGLRISWQKYEFCLISWHPADSLRFLYASSFELDGDAGAVARIEKHLMFLTNREIHKLSSEGEMLLVFRETFANHVMTLQNKIRVKVLSITMVETRCKDR